MTAEPKAFASLSSGLLARKGAARPAMRPQGFGGQMGGGLDDLGWNDMGFEPPKPADAPVRDDAHDAFGDELAEQPLRNPVAALTPIGSPVHDQQAELADRFGADADELEDEIDETAEPFAGLERPPEVDADAALQADLPEADIVPIPARPPVIAAKPVAIAPAPLPTPAAVAEAAPRRQPRPRSAPGMGAKAAFTLRLDPERHLKLRLACAVSGRSAQMLVTDALDQLLASMPELDSMAERAPSPKRAKS